MILKDGRTKKTRIRGSKIGITGKLRVDAEERGDGDRSQGCTGPQVGTRIEDQTGAVSQPGFKSE